MIETLFDWMVTIVVIIVVVSLAWMVLSNGAYWGGKLGEAIAGLADFITALAQGATS